MYKTIVYRKEYKGCKPKKIRQHTTYECKMCPGSPGFCLNWFDRYKK